MSTPHTKKDEHFGKASYNLPTRLDCLADRTHEVEGNLSDSSPKGAPSSRRCSLGSLGALLGVPARRLDQHGKAHRAVSDKHRGARHGSYVAALDGGGGMGGGLLQLGAELQEGEAVGEGVCHGGILTQAGGGCLRCWGRSKVATSTSGASRVALDEDKHVLVNLAELPPRCKLL